MTNNGQTYESFLNGKMQLGGQHGFDPTFMPDFLFDFQKYMIEYGLRKGRGALFEDCGLGKTPQQLVWAQNVVEHTNKPVIIAAPLGVSYQTVREANKFDIDCRRSIDGTLHGKSIIVTNYERLHYFNPDDFSGMVCDESSILKNFKGQTKSAITEFMLKLPYRLLCTATAAPNDYIELGTSAEAIGEMGYMDMLQKFFKNEQNSLNPASGMRFGERIKWRFKHHAEVPFWKWICSWARAMRKPSDYGFSDDGFILPELIENTHIVDIPKSESSLFSDLPMFKKPVIGLKEERDERRLTIKERCEKAAELMTGHDTSVVWCHLNDEGDLLEKLIPNASQLKGGMKDEAKEEMLIAFSNGEIKKLITKPKMSGFGLNWQHCNHTVMFPSHSYEQRYQGIRRFLRFGQQSDVTVDTVATHGEVGILQNLIRKADAADKMFTELVRYMNESISMSRTKQHNKQINIPSWLTK